MNPIIGVALGPGPPAEYQVRAPNYTWLQTKKTSLCGGQPCPTMRSALTEYRLASRSLVFADCLLAEESGFRTPIWNQSEMGIGGGEKRAIGMSSKISQKT